MTRASIPTLLSLSEYARVMGLDPLHFSQGVSTLRPDPHCPQVWYQYQWGNPSIVSREDLAEVIANAERDIADWVGYWPAPTYTVEEFHQYPHPSRPGSYGSGADSYGRWKAVGLNRGYVIAGGQRETEYLGTACWYAADMDGDGFNETAVFQLTVDADLDVCQVKAYYKEYDAADAQNSRTDPASEAADPAWEVRPLRLSLTGTTLTIYTYVWDLFSPQLWEELAPSRIDADDFGDGPPVDPCTDAALTNLGSYVDQLMFYREYTDPQSQVQFLWGSDLSCTTTTACAESTQTGCFRVKDPRNSLVIPQPASYNAVTEVFDSEAWDENVEPDALRVWYLSGYTPENQRGCRTLDDFWAKIVAMLATSRLEWDLCECTNVKEISSYWRQDVAKMTRERSFNLKPEELSNPFGQRVGEVLVWRRLKNRRRRRGQAVNV